LSLLQRTYDTRTLDRLLGRTAQAEGGLDGLIRAKGDAGQVSREEVEAAVGNLDPVFNEFQKEARRGGGGADGGRLQAAVIQAQVQWNSPKIKLKDLKEVLAGLREE